MNTELPLGGIRLPGPPPDELVLQVVEVLTDGPGRGDFTLCVRGTTSHLRFRDDHLWVEGGSFDAFLAEFEVLARTRSGRASLHFMDGHTLEFFSVPGTADLAVHGHFTSHSRVGSALLPTVADFHTSLSAEFVEEVRAGWRQLVRP